MSDKHSIAAARSNLPRLVREAESGKAIELTRHGEAVAVLIGRRQYERLMSRYRSFAEAYQAFAEDIDLNALDLDPDKLFAGTRDDSHGRDFSL